MAASGQADRDLHHRRAGKMDPVASTIQFPGNRVLAIVRASDVIEGSALSGWVIARSSAAYRAGARRRMVHLFAFKPDNRKPSP